MDETEAPTSATACRDDLPRFDAKISLLGCSRALASITWLWHKSSGESHLLFATVDLVPDELPLVDCAPAPKPISLGKKSDWRIYVQNHQVPSSKAVEWYDGVVARGEWAASWLDPQIKRPTQLADVLNEPRWPDLVTLEKTTPVPFASTRSAATRAHHTLSSANAVRALLTVEETDALLEGARAVLDLDLEQSPHLWQSAHLFMPLPILRHVSSRLDSDDESGDRAILLNLVPRLGAALEGLTVEILETRPTGVRLLARGRPTSLFMRIPLDEEVEQIGIRVVHDQLGLLVDEGPYTFLRGFSMEMQMVTRHRRVSFPEGKNRPAETFKIPVAGIGEQMITGSERGLSASQLLHQATTRVRDSSASSAQLWFRDDPRAAEAEIRKVIGAAKTNVRLIDPYFTAIGAKRYLPWVTRSGVQNEILTSSGGLSGIGLESEGDEEENKRAKRELAHLEALSDELAQALAAQLINTTVVKVMTGRRPPVHDRFLVIDDKAWLLGSSLNEFGSRGTMMVELPAPARVIPELKEVWESESSLDLQVRIDQLRQQIAGTA